jgi:ABC-type phosphate transport system permease subunit
MGIQSNELNEFEGQLGRLLSPRQANPEFVQTLKNRLTTTPQITLETRKQMKTILILSAALFSGGLILFILSLIFGRSEKA